MLPLLLVAAILAPGSDSAAAPACTITWDGSASTSWHTAANWDLDRVPAAADVVCVGAGATVVHSAGSTTVRALVSEGSISLTGGTLALTGVGADESSVTAFNMSGGTVAGAGTLVVSGSLTWTGGSMNEAGTTTIGPAATLVRDGLNAVFLAAGRVLEVEGTLDLRSDRSINPSGLPAPLLRSTGTVVKSAGAGTAQISTAFENDGVVRSDAGILELRGGDGAGESGGDAGGAAATGTVRFAFGTFDLADGARLLGGVSVEGATVNVAAGATATSAGSNTLASGTLGGTGLLSVTGTLTWTGGTIGGAGTTRIEAAATVVRDGPNTVFLANGRVLEVLGTLDLRSDESINPSGAPAPLLRSTGTVVKSAGAAAAQILTAFENDGLVRSDSGILELRAGDGLGSSTGDFGGAAAVGTVRFGFGVFDLADGADLLGGVNVEGATVNVDAGATVAWAGSNTFTGGVLGGTGILAVTGTLTWTAGTMADAGTTRIGRAATLAREGPTTAFLTTGRLLEVQGTLDLRMDRPISPSAAPAPLLRSTGTVVKSAGPGTAQISTAFENDGVVRSDSGILELRGGDGAGESGGDAGGAAATGTVRFAFGTFDLADGARLLGGVRVDGATVNIVPTATATASGQNALASGVLGGTGTLTVTGTLSWTTGSMADSGTTRIGPAATLVREGVGTAFLASGRLLEVQGTLELRTDGLLNGAPTSLLRSSGTVVKSAGAGTAQISSAFENDGLVWSDSGILELRGGDGTGSSSGDYGNPAAGGAMRFAFGDFDLAAGARLLGGATLSGSRLTVAAGATVHATGANVFSSGTIDGAGTLTLDGQFDWTGGTMDGTGQTVVAAGRELTLPSCCQSLGGTRRLVNDGTIVVQGGRLNATANARLENHARIEFRGGNAVEGLTGGGRLVNTGTIEKTAGASSNVSIVLTNAGTVTSAAGQLTLRGGDGDGSQSGAFGASGGGEVVFDDGEWDVGPGTRFTGGVAIAGADISVPAGYTLPVAGAAKLTELGRLGGDGTVEIQGAFTWTDGLMDDRGLTLIAPAASITIDADSASVAGLAQGRRFLNRGALTLLRGVFVALGATVLNEGTIDVQGDASFHGGTEHAYSSPFWTLLHNTGTIRKSAGAGQSVFTAVIDNDGTFEAASGTLALRGTLLNYSDVTDSLTAGAYIARNATLELPGLPLVANAATVVLDGPSARLLSRENVFAAPAREALTRLLRNAGAGELRLANGADLTTTGQLRNAGLVTVGADSTLTAGGAYTQAAGRTELADATSRLAASAYTQSGGMLLVETSAAGTGRVTTPGAASLAGSLAVGTRAGFTPASGSTFRILDAASVSGAFGSLLELTPGIDYVVDYDALGAAVRVPAAPPAPAPPSPAKASAEPVVVVDDRLLAVLSGPWTRKASPVFHNGTYTMSSKRGARLVRAGLEARELALLVSTCRGCGSLEVYWNGRLLKRIVLAGRPTRKLVNLGAFPRVETGTLVLRVASGRQVRVDGIVQTRAA